LLVEKRRHPRDTSPRAGKLPASGRVKSARSGDWSYHAPDWQPLCLPRPALAETYSCPCRSDSAVQEKLHVPLKSEGLVPLRFARERSKWKQKEKTGKMGGNDGTISSRESRQKRFEEFALKEECALNNDGLTSRPEPITSPRLAVLLQPVFPAGRLRAVSRTGLRPLRRGLSRLRH
jgi:hypothetical protein